MNKTYKLNCQKIETLLNNAEILHYSEVSKTGYTAFYIVRFESMENVSGMGISFNSMFNLLYQAGYILPDTNNEKVIFINERAHDKNNKEVSGLMEIVVYKK